MLEPNLLIKIVLYAFAYSPHIMTFGLFIVMFETFIFRPRRQQNEYQKLVLTVYHNLAKTQGEKVANDYLKFRNIEY